MMNLWGFRQPLDTWFEIQAVVNSYRARYFAVEEAFHNTHSVKKASASGLDPFHSSGFYPILIFLYDNKQSFKTHHYIIFFPTTTLWAGSGELLYRPIIIMVVIW